MLEAAIPALWSTVHGWFTPWVLFLVLNIVIGTIAVTSKASPPAGGGEGAAAAAGGERRSLSRVPSMAMDRLRSFNMSRFTVPAPEAPVTGVLDLGSDEQLPPLEMEPEAQGELEPEHTHMERSMSEAAAEAELPRLPARLRKSASDKSAFAHFVAEEDTEVVEARRPATTRDGERRRRPVAAEPEEPVSEEEIEEAGGEVDARADDFINNFRHQLKLQRIDSFMRYRDTLRRGQATAVASAEQ
ncbi:hypothetical protein CFC21_110094 [Triticum aestivum]|nr:pathogen-associated molecular patterns-induced protein A70 [Aegilops tauschii subsp. strangulata]XP_044441868.1 pathogen-associated molecular patterns-induced protein A70-like [Triticum aestivum]KAF7109908.1 hypothetical protein CFC21_110094 [Triticum aestivum]